MLLGTPFGALERGDDCLVRLAQHMGHHIQAAAVRHPEEDFAHTVAGGRQDDFVQHRHQHVGAFDRKALLPQIGLVQEALEGFDIGEAAKERPARRTLHGLVEALGFRRVGQPGALGRKMNVVEVIPGRAGVDGAQFLHGLGRIGGGTRNVPAHHHRRERAQIGFGQPIGGQIEIGIVGDRTAKRIDIGIEMTVFPNRLGQRRGSDHLFEIGAGRRRPVRSPRHDHSTPEAPE